jgi:hypothetical protein
MEFFDEALCSNFDEKYISWYFFQDDWWYFWDENHISLKQIGKKLFLGVGCFGKRNQGKPLGLSKDFEVHVTGDSWPRKRLHLVLPMHSLQSRRVQNKELGAIATKLLLLRAPGLLVYHYQGQNLYLVNWGHFKKGVHGFLGVRFTNAISCFEPNPPGALHRDIFLGETPCRANAKEKDLGEFTLK